jgi:hypothetical protein
MLLRFLFLLTFLVTFLNWRLVCCFMGILFGSQQFSLWLDERVAELDQRSNEAHQKWADTKFDSFSRKISDGELQALREQYDWLAHERDTYRGVRAQLYECCPELRQKPRTEIHS